MKPETKIVLSIIAVALVLALVLAFEEGYLQAGWGHTHYRGLNEAGS